MRNASSGTFEAENPSSITLNSGPLLSSDFHLCELEEPSLGGIFLRAPELVEKD